RVTANSVTYALSLHDALPIYLAMLMVLSLLMLASLVYAAINERSLILQVMEQRTKDTADTYFDFINTSMMTGTMAQRGILRDKIDRKSTRLNSSHVKISYAVF